MHGCFVFSWKGLDSFECGSGYAKIVHRNVFIKFSVLPVSVLRVPISLLGLHPLRTHQGEGHVPNILLEVWSPSCSRFETTCWKVKDNGLEINAGSKGQPSGPAVCLKEKDGFEIGNESVSFQKGSSYALHLLEGKRRRLRNRKRIIVVSIGQFSCLVVLLCRRGVF